MTRKPPPTSTEVDAEGPGMAANMTVTLEDLTTDFEHCLEVWHEHGCAPPPSQTYSRQPLF